MISSVSKVIARDMDRVRNQGLGLALGLCIYHTVAQLPRVRVARQNGASDVWGTPKKNWPTKQDYKLSNCWVKSQLVSWNFLRGQSSFTHPLQLCQYTASQLLQQTFTVKFILFSWRGVWSLPRLHPSLLQNLASEQVLMQIKYFFGTDSMDSPDCLPILLSMSVFYFTFLSVFPLFSCWFRSAD